MQLQKAAGISLDYVGTKGGAQALKDVISGAVDSGFNNMSDAIRAGEKVRILAIADTQRHSFLPSVATFRELGIDVDNASVNYRGIMVPKGTPPGIISKLEQSFRKMFKSPTVRNKMEEGGSPLNIMSRNEVLSMWSQRHETLKTLLRGL